MAAIPNGNHHSRRQTASDLSQTSVCTPNDSYGYRRITVLLKEARWLVNLKRVERIRRYESLKVLAGHPTRDQLWLNDGSCIRL